MNAVKAETASSQRLLIRTFENDGGGGRRRALIEARESLVFLFACLLFSFRVFTLLDIKEEKKKKKKEKKKTHQHSPQWKSAFRGTVTCDAKVFI